MIAKTLPPGLQTALEAFAQGGGHRTPAQILAAAKRPPLRLGASQPEPRPLDRDGPAPRRWWIRPGDIEA